MSEQQKIHPYYLGQGEALFNELASMELLSSRALDERCKPIVIEMLAEVLEVEAAYAKALHDRSKARREMLERATPKP